MGAKQSASPRTNHTNGYPASNRTEHESTGFTPNIHHHHHHHHDHHHHDHHHLRPHTPPALSVDQGTSGIGRVRARSVGSVAAVARPVGIPAGSGACHANGSLGLNIYGSSPDSDASTPDDLFNDLRIRPNHFSRPSGSLPPLFHPIGIKCPVCSKLIQPDDIECHLVMCLTKPRISYNEDILREDKGECVICFDELQQGDTIARLPCLCVYHKGCIDSWFKINRSCPEHPND